MALTPVILKTGSTLASIRRLRGDFEHLFAQAMGWPLSRFRVIDATRDPLPDPRSLDGLLITGSPASVPDREPWSERAAAWVAQAVQADIPTLGVCYGHQLLAHALGGRVIQNPAGREIGQVVVAKLGEDPLLTGLPQRFPVYETHNDAVVEAPTGSLVLATNTHTPIQALAVGRWARTVQFHPEFDSEVLGYYLMERRAAIDAECGAGATDKLLNELEKIDTGRVIFRNFATYFLGVKDPAGL